MGLQAARELHVHSPLARWTKTQVRMAARHVGLPNWQAAASPCLRSRLAWGVPATRDHLHHMAQAERIVRTHLHPVPDHANLRVRLLSQQRACLELDADLWDRAHAVDWHPVLVQALGFSALQVRMFQSGSVARRDAEPV
jgi:pyridinium-3,5-biscarboxylic acid mononucleotide sulfurtransferase